MKLGDAGRDGNDPPKDLGRIPPTEATALRPTEAAGNGENGDGGEMVHPASEDDPGSEQEIRTLLYGTCHDLKDPLRVIAGHLKLLEEKLDARLDEEEREHLDYARESADQAQSLVSGLLSHARIGSNGEAEAPSDIGSILDEVLVNLNERVEAEDARVTHDLLPSLSVNRAEIAQLFQNLIENGIKYQGRDPPRIHISHRTLSDGHQFSVDDNGQGIAPGEQAGIFEMFSRGRSAGGQNGAGIGLALCKRIVENHDGEIWVDSEPGVGSTFYFTLRPESTEVRPTA